MEQSQLMELIKILKPEEKEQFISFAANSFFNDGRMKAQIIPFLDICLNFSYGDKGSSLEKNKIYSTLFPNQPFVEGRLEKVMVEAHKLIRSFLLVTKYFRQGNEFQQRLDFADEIRSRGLRNRYYQQITKLEKTQEESLLSIQYFHRQYLLEYSKYDEDSIKNLAKGDLNIPNTLHALELDFYLKRLILLNQLLLQKRITHVETPETLIGIIENFKMPEQYLVESPLIKIYFEVFTLLQKKYPTAEEVQSLFDLLLLYEAKLDNTSLHELYTFLRNLCVLSLTADYEQAELEIKLHNLYKHNLHKGYLHYEGKINRSRYWAVAINALNVNKLDWALEFIEKYKHEIRDENETQDIYRLNLANYLFRIGKFEECLDFIPATSPFVDYLLYGKRLELKALYELQSMLLPYKLDAFKMFLSRTSVKLLSDEQRKMNLDFANFLHQMMNSIVGESKRADQLSSRLAKKKQAHEWRWLQSKANALK